jgi:predicted nucleic acid-binding protein
MVDQLKLLVDTNVWLELLLNQNKRDEVQTFLDRSDPSNLALTDFSLYSIGIILTRFKKMDLFKKFIGDLLRKGGVNIVRIPAERFPDIPQVIVRYCLDFDDAYQYIAAEHHDLRIVSFDTDFDRTEDGRISPGKAV